MQFPAHPFWDFSLEIYGTDGVAPACLALQERHGVDVNFLLLCLWLGRAGHGAVGQAAIARLHEAAALWHEEVVRGLRRVRRRLKDDLGPVDQDLAQALRRRVQKIEIDAEHIEQLALADALDALDPGTGDRPSGAAEAAANLRDYFALLGATLEPADERPVRAVLAAGFPDEGDGRLDSLCSAIAG